MGDIKSAREIAMEKVEELGEPTDEERLRWKYTPEGEKIVLYTGNFQTYQGIPLLLEAAARVKEKSVFLLVGGSKAEIDEMKQKAARLSIEDKIIFTGTVAPSEVSIYISLSDVLVSPRISGTNTPLKIYSMMKSGKPLVATCLRTHTQVLNEKNSILVEPDPDSLAEGISFALSSKKAQHIARSCKEFTDREYTYPKYKKKISQALELALKNSR